MDVFCHSFDFACPEYSFDRCRAEEFASPIRDWSFLVSAHVSGVRDVGSDQIERLAGGEIVDVSTKLRWDSWHLHFGKAN